MESIGVKIDFVISKMKGIGVKIDFVISKMKSIGVTITLKHDDVMNQYGCLWWWINPY